MSHEPSTDTALPFLLEIGSEEIPARFIPTAVKELEKRVTSALESEELAADRLKVLATPRRMALIIDRLAARQPDREMEIKGPPVQVAFDADGNPTKAAEGFARKAGIDLADCERGSDARGEYLVARQVRTGREAGEILAQIIPEIVLGLPFRKVMRWGDHDLEYPRPLQWVVALLGDELVPMKVDYLESGRVSRGHRTLAQGRDVPIASASTYLADLEAAGVMVDQERRRTRISEGIAELLAGYDPEATLVGDEDLLTEIVYLCEFPTPFLGSFDTKFFELPAEVITTALKSHQRYFTVARQGVHDLFPRFAAVRDGGNDHLENVVHGNQRVLSARLADALFYWEFDQKKTPDERTQMLGTVTWLEGFGTVLDKTRRLEALVDWLWLNGLGDGGDPPAALARSARICKSDLVSEMIKDGKEFTKLEGFIGARYAKAAGETPEVCLALERHSYPRGSGSELPGDRISSVLSVADRLDTLTGCWLAGFAPTGAKDPYALRRHVLAVIRILLDLDAAADLSAAVGRSLEDWEKRGLPLADVRSEIEEFIRTRMEGYLTEILSCDPEVLRAILPVRWSDPVAALRWVEALSGFRDREDFQQLATGFKRCRNILAGETLPLEAREACLERWVRGGSGAVGENFEDLPDPVEQELRGQVAQAAPRLVEAEAHGGFVEVFEILSSLGPAIDDFFDSVRVNVPDEGIKALRHAFLREIHGLFARYAEFAEVAPQDK